MAFQGVVAGWLQAGVKGGAITRGRVGTDRVALGAPQGVLAEVEGVMIQLSAPFNMSAPLPLPPPRNRICPRTQQAPKWLWTITCQNVTTQHYNVVSQAPKLTGLPR
ncbi:fibrillin-1 [Platysternon megacephalum]|uniref:Fibrillin-1 n=1 Tax=Platysternon megacephalum TaxID=55544 RepID=A0A4D9ER59_9SAUR|nr:fibrillin-1 [Platysternon megacephalum]